MRTDISTRIAALMLCMIFLSNDVVASVHAIYRGVPDVKNYVPKSEQEDDQDSDKKILSEIEIPAQSEDRSMEAPENPEVMPSIKVMFARERSALIGVSMKDPMGNPRDDFFSFELTAQEAAFYSHAKLKYKLRGARSSTSLAKSINDNPTFGATELEPFNEWVNGEDVVPISELRTGTNLMRFGLPVTTMMSVEIKDFEIELLQMEGEESTIIYLEEDRVEEDQNFTFVGGGAQLVKRYKASDLQVPSIPRDITNVTMGAHAYRLRSDAEIGGGLIGIAIDASRLPAGKSVRDVSTFYFNYETRGWIPVSSDSVHVDTETGVAINFVPMQPGSQYFNGIIKTPNMPESSANLSTSLGGIQPANPSAGLVGVSAPGISRTGEAATSFPIKLPQGRNGMTPALSINYNSDAGTGWLGVGWNIAVPKITVDTRWGVPKFPANVQEEVYLLNGESLAQEGEEKGNRIRLTGNPTPLPSRKTGTVQFFEKTRSSWRKIERKGNNPREYIWIVTMPDQSKFFYGTRNGTSPDASTTLFDETLAASNRNIVEWYLTKSIDRWGNTIEYFYDNTAVISSYENELLAGGQLRNLRKIVYTGYEKGEDTESGSYVIFFESSNGRVDAQVNMRYGFKVVNYHRLDQIIVQYGGVNNSTAGGVGTTEIRKYELVYNNNATTFHKNTLTDIIEKVGGSEFYRNTFEYHDAVYSFSGTPDVTLNVSSSALGGTLSGSINTGGSLGVGWGPTGNQAKRNYIAAGYAYSDANERVTNSIMDVNGDGIPDLVNNGTSSITYKAGRIDENGDYSLSADLVTLGTGSVVPSGAYQSYTTGDQVSINANVAITSSVSAGAGYAHNTTRTKTRGFLTDINGDGVIDWVNNGRTHFGYYDLSTDNVHFDASSIYSPNPIVNTQSVSAPPADAENSQPVRTVRSWKAPFDGTVNISSTAYLNSQSTDGVKLQIDHAEASSSGIEVAATALNASPGSVAMNATGISVSKGDYLFFRVEGNTEATYDLVNWDPEISYTSLSLFDANEVSYSTFKPNYEFALSGKDVLSFEGVQDVEVLFPNKTYSGLTDDVDFVVTLTRENSSGTTTEKYVQSLDGTLTSNTVQRGSFVSTTTSHLEDVLQTGGLTLGVDETLEIAFEVQARSNVRWSDINWRPTIKSTKSGVTNVLYPVVDLQFFGTPHKLIGERDISSFTSYSNVKITPYIKTAILNALPSGSGVYEGDFTVKTTSKYLNSFHFVVDKGLGTITWTSNDGITFSGSHILSLDSFLILDVATDLDAGAFWAEFTTDDPILAPVLEDNTTVYIQNISCSPTCSIASSVATVGEVYERTDGDALNSDVTGWGAFGWAGTSTTAIPIDELVALDYSDPSLQSDFNNLPNGSYADINTIASTYGIDPFSTTNLFRSFVPQRGEEVSDAHLSSIGSAGTEALDRFHMIFSTHSAVYQSHSSNVVLGIDPYSNEPEPDYVAINNYNRPATIIESSTVNQSWFVNGSFKTELGQTDQNALGVSGSYSTTYPFSELYSRGSHARSGNIDMNGDGYPDNVVYDKKKDKLSWQGTNRLGGFAGSSLEDFKKSRYISRNQFLSHGGVVGVGYTSQDQSTLLSAGLSGSFVNSKSTMENGIMDFNGDGLPDFYISSATDEFVTSSSSSLELGNGSSFMSADGLNFTGSASHNSGKTYSGSLSPGAKGGLFGFGFGVGTVYHPQELESYFVDFTGDGLPDRLTKDGNTWKINVNQGAQLTSSSTNMANSNIAIENMTESLIGRLNIGTAVGFTGAFVLGSATRTAADGSSESRAQFIDMNGDNLPDLVTYNDVGGYSLNIYYNQGGKANLLKTINNPLGGKINLSYKRVGNKYGLHDREIYNHQYDQYDWEPQVMWDMPHSKWVLASVEAKDGFNLVDGSQNDLDGSDSFITYFMYDGGMYSRREREFLGFTRIAQKSSRIAVDAGEGQIATKTPVSENNPHIEKWMITDFHEVKSIDPFERRELEYLKGLTTARYNYIRYDYVDANENPIEEWIPQSIQKYNYSYYFWHQKGEFDQGKVNYSEPVNFAAISEAACVYPRLDNTESFNFIDDTDYFYSSVVEYEYDRYANVRRVFRNGNTETGLRTLKDQGLDYLDTSVDPPVSHNVLEWNYPLQFTVDIIAIMDYYYPGPTTTDMVGQLSRHRIYVNDTTDVNLKRRTDVASLDDLGLAPDEIRHYRSLTDYSTTLLQYDKYGNVKRADLPNSAESDALAIILTYEATLNTYVTQMEHSYTDKDNGTTTLSSETTKFNYDLKTGLLRKKVDANGHPMEFYYDGFYRPEYIYGPRELVSGPYSVRYEYFDPSTFTGVLSKTNLPWAITRRYMNNTPSSNGLGDWNTPSDYSPANITNVNVLHADSRNRNVASKFKSGTFLRSSVVLDGLGRNIQTKQELSKYNGTKNDLSFMSSGWAVYDDWNRAVESYRYQELTGAYTGIAMLKEFRLPASPIRDGYSSFDKYGRAFQTYSMNAEHVNASGTPSTQFTEVGAFLQWQMDNGKRRLVATQYVDGAPYSETRTYINGIGQAYKVQEGDGTTFTTTEYSLNAINEMLSVKDPMAISTSYTYDMMGRPVQEVHADKGTTNTTYDDAGNITKINIAGRLTGTVDISFEYMYNRLTKKTFPEANNINNVEIEYGKTGSTVNGVGRPIRITQGGTGGDVLVDEFAYDEMGKLVRENRTIAVPMAGEYNFKTDYVYDSWGRLNHMRYPDGEVLTYKYAVGGELESLETSEAFYQGSEYISEIQYEGDGRRSKIVNGNGTTQAYTYDNKTDMLSGSILKTSVNNAAQAQQTLLNKTFTYNASGNIASIKNTAGVYQGMGGNYENNYTYDAWDRLSSANGFIKGQGSDYWDSYSLSMTYGADGRITDKDQSVTNTSGTVQHPTADYDLDYVYTANTHQLKTLTEVGGDAISYSYDKRGNLKERINNTKASKSEYFLFDHTDRMMAVRQNDDTEVHHYVYDANGTRLMKSTATDRDFYVNNDGTPDWELSPYIVYTGPHYVFQAYRNYVDVSKHYFADGQRVVTRMELEERFYQAPGHEPGDGPFFNQYDPDQTQLPGPEAAAQNNVVLDQWDEIGTWAGVEGMEAESFKGDQSLPIYHPVGWTRGACFEGGTRFNTDFCNCIDANYDYGTPGYINCIETFPNLYWYHVDYMGHTEYVTDLAGSPYEYYFYMPFGEVAVAQHANNDGYSNPYRFASAEHDPETGFVLMGARYYDPKASIWISADPLSHMRDWLTPYNYVRNNPIMFSDPSGLLDKRTMTGPGDPPTMSMEVNAKISLAVKMGFNVSASQRTDDYGQFTIDYEITTVDGDLVERGRRSGGPEDRLYASHSFDFTEEGPISLHPKEMSDWSLETSQSENIEDMPSGGGAMDIAQTALDMVGLVPVVGEAADVINGIIYFAQGDYVNGGLSLLSAIPLIGWAGSALKGANKANKAYESSRAAMRTARGVTNAVPGRLARVVPGNISSKTLGAPGAKDVFVTAADDIAGMNARQIANRLTIPNSSSGFKIIEFNTPRIGLGSPINRTNPGFVGFGRTAGGAREFVIPNQVIPRGSSIKLVR